MQSSIIQPRQVKGYEQARVAKLTPQIPKTPPSILHKPTASQRLTRVAIVGAVVVISIIITMFAASEEGRLPLSGIIALLTVSGVGIAILWFTVKQWGKTLIAELQQGYTTNTFKLARFWTAPSPDGVITNGWIQWDWDATWVLRNDGTVISSPTSLADPPGLYPSPHREGEFELWTGYQWTNYFPPSKN